MTAEIICLVLPEPVGATAAESCSRCFLNAKKQGFVAGNFGFFHDVVSVAKARKDADSTPAQVHRVE